MGACGGCCSFLSASICAFNSSFFFLSASISAEVLQRIVLTVWHGEFQQWQLRRYLLPASTEKFSTRQTGAGQQ